MKSLNSLAEPCAYTYSLNTYYPAEFPEYTSGILGRNSIFLVTVNVTKNLNCVEFFTVTSKFSVPLTAAESVQLLA